MNAGTFDGQRKENIRISKNVVIEEIPRVRLEVGEVERPSVNWNGEAEFTLFVGFAVQRRKRKSGIHCELKQRARDCG